MTISRVAGVRGAGSRHLIHADLQPANVIIHRGRLRPIDFYEVIWGYAVQDVALSLFDPFSYGRIGCFPISKRRVMFMTLTRKENCARRERPQEHRPCGLKERERTSAARLLVQERGHAEWRSGSQVDCDGFAQSHSNPVKWQRMCQRRRGTFVGGHRSDAFVLRKKLR